MAPLRVLIVCEVLHPDTVGGAGRVAAEQAAGLAAAGVDVRVISRMTATAKTSRESRNGYEIFRFGIDRSTPLALYATTRRGVSECASRATAEWRPDVIDLHQPLAGLHAMNEPLLRGTPVVYTFHSSWSDELVIRGGLYRLLARHSASIERRVISAASRIVCLSEFSRRRVENIAPHVPATIVPGGVDLEQFPIKERSRHNVPPVFLTVRNLQPRMGIDRLIQAAGLLRTNGLSFSLQIGGTGPLEAKLKKLAASTGAPCSFLGRIPEERLAEVYQGADLFVLPTVALEGFGLVILESFATGTPVIGTPVGAIPETVGLQGDGYIAAGTDPESLANAITHFLERDDRIASDRLNAIARDFTWRRRAERLIRIYREVIATAAGRGSDGDLSDFEMGSGGGESSHERNA